MMLSTCVLWLIVPHQLKSLNKSCFNWSCLIIWLQGSCKDSMVFWLLIDLKKKKKKSPPCKVLPIYLTCFHSNTPDLNLWFQVTGGGSQVKSWGFKLLPIHIGPGFSPRCWIVQGRCRPSFPFFSWGIPSWHS